MAKIKINMNKAVEIRKQQLREARKPRLEMLDILYQRADEQNDTTRKAEIAAQKQALRDITKDPALEKAKTVDDLFNVRLPL